MTDIDAVELPGDGSGGSTYAPPPEVAENAKPCLVVNDLHIVYKVLGGKRVGSSVDAKKGVLSRLLAKGRGPVSGVTEVHAVRGISFVARTGESIGIVGVNGSGKSTLLRAIAGLHPPTRGSVYVAGQPALLGVSAVLMADLTGERNVIIGGLALGLSLKEIRARFDEIVDFAGIGDFVYLPMKAYSSGMAARLRFSISVAAAPDILMIDEALVTGDAAFQTKSQEKIDQIRAQAGTVFLVSHSIKTVREVCSRVMWVHQGRLVMDGPTDEVCDAYTEFAKAQKATKKPAPRKS